MRFRLIYDGELRAGQRERFEKEPIHISEHKQSIRKVFHRQMKRLWETNWFLNSHRVYASDYGIDLSASEIDARWGASTNQMVPLLDAVAFNYREDGYRFVPLVRQDW
jgi:hypothetical protein